MLMLFYSADEFGLLWFSLHIWMLVW